MKKIVITTILFLVSSIIINAQDFFDDFESYNVGEQLCVQNPEDWITWSNTPGSEEDPFIEYLESNVVHLVAYNDPVYVVPNYTFGLWEIQFDLYVPEGGDAYFNTLQEFYSTPSWGMQVYFGHTNDGEGNIDGGGPLAQVFTFDYDTWMTVKVTVDIENDWGEFFLDDALIHDWIWSTGTFGTGTLNQLGGSNFYAWLDGVYANPNFYIDNYSVDYIGIWYHPPQNVIADVVNMFGEVHVSWLPPEEGESIGYKIWRNNDSLDYVDPLTLEYDDLDLDPGTYEYCVSAVYDEGESPHTCADLIVIAAPPPPPAPTNLTGPECYNPGETIHLTWDYNNYLGEWIRWDAGVNTGNGIGVLGGGPFSCASHWYPDQLAPYNGLQIMEIEFYNNGDPEATYTIKIWTGPDGTNEVYSQEVNSFNVDDWNTVVLDTPHTISVTEDLWFGYEITHSYGTFPAGCDDGPAISGNGEMIHTGISWLPMSDMGFDYNWNLAAMVGLADGIKDFNHFNMYVKYPGSTFFGVIGPVTSPFSFVAGESGVYEFVVTAVWDPEGESLPSNIYSVDLCTNVLNSKAKNINVFPIPASDIVTIESGFEIVFLKVYNPTGQIIIEKEVNNNIYKIDVSLFNPGIYFLQIDFEDEQFLRKIVVE